jgi:group I intron endonuclease
MHSIYFFQHKINLKVYIGQAMDPKSRFSGHKRAEKMTEENPPIFLFDRAIHKYGIDAFDYYIIEEVETQNEANLQEKFWIAFFLSNRKEFGYNIDEGGKNSPKSESTRKKMSESAKGKKGTNLGRTFSQEWRAKISKANTGKKVHNRKFSDEKEKEICDRYVVDQDSMYKIAKDLGCRRGNIKNVLIRNDIELRETKSSIANRENGKKRRKLSEEKELEICEKYKEGGISMKDLERKYGCSDSTIKSILTRNDIKLGE